MRLGNIKWKKVLTENYLLCIMSALLLFFVGYVIYISFSYYWDNFHSDIAADLAFVREAARQFRLFPYGWPHLQEMRVVHITTIMIPFYWITGNINLSYPLATSFMVLVNVYLFYWMLNYRKRSLLPIVIGAIVLLITFSRYTQVSVFSILFINSSLAPTLSVIFATIGFYMRLKTASTPGKLLVYRILWAVLLLLAFLGGIQSSRLLLGLYIPLLIIEVYDLVGKILENKSFKAKNIEKSAIFVALCFALNVLGVLVIMRQINSGAVLVEWGLVTTGLSISANNSIWPNLERFLPEFIAAFGMFGGSSVFSSEGIVYLGRLGLIAAGLVMYKKINKLSDYENKDKSIFYIFIASVAALSFAMVFVRTGIGERFIFPVTAMLGVLFVYIADYFVENNRKVLCLIMCAVIFVMTVLSIPAITMERRESHVQNRQTVADFIRNEGFTIGYGVFWQGLVIAAVADYDFTVISICDVQRPRLVPRPHGVSMQDFNHDEDRVFLIIAANHANDAMGNDQSRAILESGVRHEFPGGWLVYTFEQNPWRVR